MISNLDYIKSNIDIVSIIENYLPVKKAGSNYITSCPFHDENTPSLVINKQKNIFHCFGCGEGGNAIDFIMKHEKLEFNHAVKKASEICNITVYESNNKKHNETREIQEKLESFYIESLKNLMQNERLLNYLHKRGFKKEYLESFGIGYALSSEKIIEILGHKLAYSLGFFTEKGYNFFQNRLLFTIRDEKGKIVGFSGRATEYEENKKIAKYINSKESFLYKKNNVLYNFTNALNIIKRSNAPYIYIVEGYFDALTCNLLEIPSVAVCSANLHLNQLKILTKLIKSDIKIHIALDSDEAGRSGSIRAYKMLFKFGYLESKISRLDKKYKDLNEFYKKADSPFIPFKHYDGLDFCLRVETATAPSIKEKKEVLNYYEKIAKDSNDIFTKNYIYKYLNKYLTTPQQNNTSPLRESKHTEELELLTQLAIDKEKRFLCNDLLSENDFLTPQHKTLFNDIMQSKETKEVRELILKDTETQDIDLFYKIALRFKIFRLKETLKIAINKKDFKYINAINAKLKDLKLRQEIPF